MHRAGAGWPSEYYVVNYARQAVAADLISVAGHSLRLHHTPIEGRCSRSRVPGEEQWRPQAPRLRNSAVPSSRSTQRGRL